jgi:diacylglycerol kinase family enzyme
MPARTLLIANPASRNRATARRLAALEARLRSALGPLEVACTRAPRDAERLTREGVRAGVERVIVAGGDGTLSEVVTGLLGASLGDYAAIGLLPLGSASDFGRGLGAARALDRAIEELAAGRTRRVDAGRVIYRRRDGSSATAYFANVASLGLSAEVADRVNRGRKSDRVSRARNSDRASRGRNSDRASRARNCPGGRLAYVLAALRGVLGWRGERVAVSADGQRVFEGEVCLAAVANGPCFGGGMRIAPGARVDDGCFDWVIVPALPRAALLAKLPLLYRGSHLRDARVLHGRASLVEAHAAEPVRVELDGEVVGALPARFELMPSSLTIFGVGS